jgi:MerR family copper efflux transcriptional regulator
MKLPDLVEATADHRVTPRFVRFLVAQNVIPAPSGGRTYAEYGPIHLAGIRRYLRLRDLGLSIAAIKRLDEGESPEAVAMELAPGLTLSIRPAELDALPDPEVLAERIAAAVADIIRPAASVEREAATDTKRTE